MLTFPVTTSGYISSSESASVPREGAKEIVISFLDSLNSLLPVIRQLIIGLPILLSTFVGLSIMFLLMTYVIIPLWTKLWRPWLRKKRLFYPRLFLVGLAKLHSRLLTSDGVDKASYF